MIKIQNLNNKFQAFNIAVTLIVLCLNTFYYTNSENIVKAFAAPERNVIGFVDNLNPQTGELTGWACNGNEYSIPSLEVYLDGKQISYIQTDEFSIERPDVEQIFTSECKIGKPKGFRHYPFQYDQATKHQLTSANKDFSLEVKWRNFNSQYFNLGNSPRVVTISNVEPIGNIDSIKGRTVSGWFCDPNQSEINLKAKLYVRIDEGYSVSPKKMITDNLITGNIRSDVNQLTECKMGNHGFSFTLPDIIKYTSPYYPDEERIVPAGSYVYLSVQDYSAQGVLLTDTYITTNLKLES
jgi:hypothetical protein